MHEYKAIAALASAGRALRATRPELAGECVTAAEALWLIERDATKGFDARTMAAAQLWKTTGKAMYRDEILGARVRIVADSAKIAWAIAPVAAPLKDDNFTRALREAVRRDFEAL